MLQGLLLQDMQYSIGIGSWTSSFDSWRTILNIICFFDLTDNFQTIFVAAVEIVVWWTLLLFIFYIIVNTFLYDAWRTALFGHFQRILVGFLCELLSNLGNLFLMNFKIFA